MLMRLWPGNRWGPLGRPHMPEKHHLANEATILDLRADRLERRLVQRLAARARLRQLERGEPGP